MGRIILFILLFISFVSFGQTFNMKDSRSGDIVQRIIQTTKSGGIVKYLLITGTDTAEIRWNGTKLLLDGYNLADSVDLTTDSIAAHRIQINKNMDSLAVHLDTLQILRIQINKNIDSLGVHLDTLQVHRTDINSLLDSISTHTDTLQDLRMDVNINIDSLAVHRTDIDTTVIDIDYTNISKIKHTRGDGTFFYKSGGHNHDQYKLESDTTTIFSILKLVPLAGDPSTPSEGWIYSNSTDNHLYFYNGSGWVQLDN